MPFQPYFFNDTPTALELIYRALAELRVLKPTVDELKTKVDELVNNLDKGIKEEVERVINQMYENGDLTEILNQCFEDFIETPFENYKADNKEYVDDEINKVNNEILLNRGKSSIIDFERCSRVLKTTAHYMWSQPNYSQAADDTRTAHYSFLQGACNFSHNGENFNAMLFVPNDGSKFCEDGSAYTGTGLLEIRKLGGNLIKSIEIPAVVGHGQCIAYHNGYLYFEGSNPLDANAGRKLRRISFDFQNNSNVESYLLPYEFNGIHSYNGELYITKATYLEIDVFKVDMNSDGITPTGTVSNQLVMSPPFIGFYGSATPRNTTIFSAGFSVTEKYYYFGTHKPSGILRCKRNFNAETGDEENFTPDWFYSIPYMLNNNDFKTGEIEGCTVYDNGNCILFTTQHINTKAIACHDITQIFRQNLFNNLSLSYDTQNPYTGRANIYIDAYSSEHMNANGKSWNTAFRTIDEACWWFNNSPKAGYGHFYFQGNTGYPAFCVSGKTYYFDGKGNDHTDQKTADRKSLTVLGNLIAFGGIIHCENIRFFSVIHYLADSDVNADTAHMLDSYIHQKQSPVYAQDCMIYFINTGCSFSNNPNVKNAIYLGNAAGLYSSEDNTVVNTYGQPHWDGTTCNVAVIDKTVTPWAVSYPSQSRYFIRLGSCLFNAHKDLYESGDGLTSTNAINLLST